jgi:S-DNA-T family DNA segregation ATPase FtsK/SpoIIIE
MASFARSVQAGRGFLPPGAAIFLRHRVMEVVGLVVLALALASVVALVTYHGTDPSLNRASGNTPRNMLGWPGAWFADLMLQTLGFAAYLLPLAFLAWGLRLLRAKRLRFFGVRLALLLAALLLFAAASAGIEDGGAWVTHAGAGGVVGAALNALMREVILTYSSGGLLPWLEIVAGLAALACLVPVAGMEREHLPLALRGLLLPMVAARWLLRAGIALWRGRPAFEREALAEPPAPPTGYAEVPGEIDASQYDPRNFAEAEREVPPPNTRLFEIYRPQTAAVAVERPADAAVPADRVVGDRIVGRRIEPAFNAPSAEPPVDTGLPPLPPVPEGVVEEETPEAPPAPAAVARPNVVPIEAARRDAEEAAGPQIVARRPATAPRSKRGATASQATFDFSTGEYALPPLDMLQEPKRSLVQTQAIDEDALTQNAHLLETVLDDFGVKGQIVKVRPGPVVTLYELEPAPGIKSSRIINLADDIARSMSAVATRVATVPGRNVIGIELPNARRETVYLRELLSTRQYEDQRVMLPLVLGKDIGGEPMIADLAKMPHLLIGGTTGSGKSVAINTMILSLLYRLPPDRCRFIMIDPKMLELSVYADIPHLLTPVVTEPRKAIVALKWTVREMEERYRLMSQLGVRNIAGFNERLAEARRNGETLTRPVQVGIDPDTRKPLFEDQAIDLDPLPFIVVIIDEMADLMLVAGKEIEAAVQRLAQMARAAGIHVIMATQRPSVDVITGTIKANFPTRISFQVTSKIDSRTILGEQGGEQLLGQGDMLYMAGGGRIARVHGPFVSDGEVERVVKHLRGQAQPAYIDDVTDDRDGGDGKGGGGETEEVEYDELYDQAVAIVTRERKASTSFIQRHLSIGYNRAARIIERMEIEGVVGPSNSVGKREVLARDIDGDAA